tara:strand:- start:2944 stop:3354 length:411 start_codon:yes stop_codon:yes gene_type:complete
MENKRNLELEWSILQPSADQYEHKALSIKLVSLVIVAAALAVSADGSICMLLILAFWMTESVYKTFQFRIFERLEKIESAIAGNATDATAFQFNVECSKSRGGLKGVLGEYLRSALRPTVAITYLALIGIVFIAMI